MKKMHIAGVTALALAVLVGSVHAGGALKSGPQAGERVPGPFHPLNVTGENAGQKHCLFCEYGTSPVVMIFARNTSPALTTLVKEVEAVTAKNKKQNMGSCVIFLNDNEKLATELKDLASKNNLKHTVLSIDNPAGPEGYKVAAKADVTVLLYEDHTVRANHTFAKGQLTPAAVQKILADLPKITNPK